jgi:hypothetical protein
MSRFQFNSIQAFVVAAALAAVAQAPVVSLFAQQSGAPQNRIVLSTNESLPGFHAPTSPLPARPAAVRLHPRPAPLTSQQINSAIGQYRLKIVGLAPPVAPDITYQLELFDNNTGSEVNTNVIQSSVFYSNGGNGTMGYVQITYNVSPGAQHLLDCSLGQDGSFRVVTMFNLANSNPSAESTIGSFSGHLLIPFNPAPNGVKTAAAIIYFTNIEFDGCELKSVSQ